MTILTIQIPDDVAKGLMTEAAQRHVSPEQVAAERVIRPSTVKKPEPVQRSCASFFGAATGVYASPEEVDRAIEEMRNEW